MKKHLWLFLLGGAVLFLFLSRKKPAAKAPTATAGTAGAVPVLTDLWKNISSGSVNDNTPQLITSASNAVSTLFKGVQSLFSTGKSAPATSSQTIGNAAPVDLNSDVSSYDLSTDYWPTLGTDWLDSGYWEDYA